MELDFTALEGIIDQASKQRKPPEPMTPEGMAAEIYKTVEDMDTGKAAEAVLKAVECIAIKKENPRLYADVVMSLYKSGVNMRKLSQEAEALAKEEGITPAKRRMYELLALLYRHDAEEIEEVL